MGLPLKSLQGFGVPAKSYGFANKQLAWETIAPLLERASPLRTAHLRDPVGPQIQFASESFIDEIAAAIASDPVAFRLRYLKAPRDIAVVKAAAERAQWDPRPSPRPDRSGDTLSGRGIAYAQRWVPWSRSSPRLKSIGAAARCGRASSPSRMIAG